MQKSLTLKVSLSLDLETERFGMCQRWWINDFYDYWEDKLLNFDLKKASTSSDYNLNYKNDDNACQ